jgi:hypothetical protein
MEQNIVVERHYLTPQMYREIYQGYPHYLTNRYNQPYFPIINQHPILASSNNHNQPVAVFPHTNINTNSNTTNQTNVPQNNAFQNNRINNNENTSVEIRNLISNLINNNTPFQLEVSTLPITRILNQFRTEINANENNNDSGINLANINNISNVIVFSSLNYINTLSLNSSSSSSSSSNTTSEMCSICQNDFEGTDIVRRLNNCSHLFHLNCVDTWLSNHSTCPTCRHNLINDITENASSTENNSESEYNEDENDDNDDNDDDNDNDNVDSDDSDCENECSCCEEEENCENNIHTTSTINPSVNLNEDNEREGLINYFIATNSRSTANTANTSNTANNSNVIVLSSNSSQQTSSTTSNIPSRNSNPIPATNNSNIRVFTTNIPATALNELQNDLNNIINLGTPLINTIMRTNNTASQLNSTQINGQVNTMFNTINPLLAAISNMMQ